MRMMPSKRGSARDPVQAVGMSDWKAGDDVETFDLPNGGAVVVRFSRPDMVQRYTRARASERAAAEARALNLGDL